jgi:hypothetical protein
MNYVLDNLSARENLKQLERLAVLELSPSEGRFVIRSFGIEQN